MKLKKTLSGVLAAAMVVSLTPAMAFATSTNTVAKVPTVAGDEDIPATTISFEIKDATWGNTEAQHVKLTFGNAEWDTNPTVGSIAGSNEVVKLKFTGAAKQNDVINVGGTTYVYGTDQANVADTAADFKANAAIPGYTSAVDAADDTVVILTANGVGDKTDLTASVTPTTGGTLAASIVSITNGVAAGGDAIISIEETSSTGSHVGNPTIKDVISVSDNSIEFSFIPTVGTKGNFINVKFDSGDLVSLTEDGPITVAIDGLDSAVTSSTLTIANVGTSTSVASVNGDPKTWDRQDVTSTIIKTSIEIRETAVNSLKKDSEQVIELRLPKGVTWNADTSVVGSLVATTPAPKIDATGRYLTITFTVGGADDTRDVMTIKPSISIGKDASKGDIAVSLVGKYASGNANTVSDADGLVIAKYGDESVTVSTLESVPTIYSGYLADKNEKDFYLYVSLKENMAKALTAGKFVDFDLPEEVQIIGEIKTSDKLGDSGTFGTTNLAGLITIGDENYANNITNTNVNALKMQDSSSFSFKVPAPGVVGGVTWANDKGNTITFKIPVTVKANYTGEIKAIVSGAKAGVEETELVVANAEHAVTLDTNPTEVKNGVQKQNVADVTIVENVFGYIDDGSTLELSVDNLGLADGSISLQDAKATVIEGDLEIGKVTKANGKITISVKHASTKPSKILVSGITATLNRTLPEGGYDLKLGESGVVNNNGYDNADFPKWAVKVSDYIKIVTPAESVTVSEKVDAQFVIGEASYTNNGTATEMDAAAYIDSHNRTMVPIRYVANACGISENDIRWEQNTQTAIINGLNTVVTVKMGSNKLQTSTGEITMDTVAVNNNGRIYVPVRYIANALGANVSWDAATKTVTLTK